MNRRHSVALLAGGGILPPLSAGRGSTAGWQQSSAASASSESPLSSVGRLDGADSSLSTNDSGSLGGNTMPPITPSKGRSRRSSMMAAPGSLRLTTPGPVRPGSAGGADQVSKEDAETMLSAAMATADVGKLLTAIGQAKGACVDAGLVEEATKLLQTLECKSWLQRAVKSEKAVDVKATLEKAKALGLPPEDLQEARDLLVDLERETQLRCAMEIGERDPLNWAIENASDGVRPKTMTEARQKLRQLEAAGSVRSALRGKNMQKIEEAISNATEAGVPKGEMEDAMLFVDDRKKVLRRASTTDAIGKQRNSVTAADAPSDNVDLERLLHAIKLRELGPLKMAIKMAVEAGGMASHVEKGKQTLAQLEAQRALAVALKGKPDRKKIQDAFQKAEETELQTDEVQQAQKILALMDAESELDTALKTKDLDALRDAIDKAKRMNLPNKVTIEKAERIMIQLSEGSKAPELERVGSADAGKKRNTMKSPSEESGAKGSRSTKRRASAA